MTERLGLVLAQIVVSDDVEANVATLLDAVGAARAGDVLLAPEGAVSGYSSEPGFLDRLVPDRIEAGLAELSKAAVERRIALCLGTCLWERGAWSNAAILLGPDGTRQVYRKANLATAERGRMRPGDRLDTFRLAPPCLRIPVGIQICRELRFPDQWRVLSEQGAQVLLHPNNAVGDREPFPVWRSQLVSRAAENQRVVASVNACAPRQKCPSVVIDPAGRVAAELPPGTPAAERVELSLDGVADYYLSQRRDDLTDQRQRVSAGTG